MQISGGGTITAAGQIANGIITNAHIASNAGIATTKFATDALRAIQSSTVRVTDAFTTTSTTYVDLTNATLSLTPVTANNHWLAIFQVNTDNLTGSSDNNFELQLDGVTVTSTFAQLDSTNRSQGGLVSTGTDLSAAAHTWKIRMKVNQGTGRIAVAGTEMACQLTVLLLEQVA